MKIYTPTDYSELCNGYKIDRSVDYVYVDNVYTRHDISYIDCTIVDNELFTTIAIDDSTTFIDSTSIIVTGVNIINLDEYGQFTLYSMGKNRMFKFYPTYRLNGILNPSNFTNDYSEIDITETPITGDSTCIIRMYADNGNISNLDVSQIASDNYALEFSTNGIDWYSSLSLLSITLGSYQDVYIKTTYTYDDYGCYLNAIMIEYNENTSDYTRYLNNTNYVSYSGGIIRALYFDDINIAFGYSDSFVIEFDEYTGILSGTLTVKNTNRLGYLSASSNSVYFAVDENLDITGDIDLPLSVVIDDTQGIVSATFTLPENHNIEYITCNDIQKNVFQKTSVTFEFDDFEYDISKDVYWQLYNTHETTAIDTTNYNCVSGVLNNGIDSYINGINLNIDSTALTTIVDDDVALLTGERRNRLSLVVDGYTIDIVRNLFSSMYIDLSSFELANESNAGYGTSSNDYFEYDDVNDILYLVFDGNKVAKIDFDNCIIYAPEYKQELDYAYIDIDSVSYSGYTYNYIVLNQCIVFAFNESTLQIAEIYQ